jgi:hypothetical protein
MASILQESRNTDEDTNWSLLSLLALTVFLTLQIAFIAKPAYVPDPDEIKHVDGKRLRTVMIRNQKMLDAEVLVRSDEGAIGGNDPRLPQIHR